MQRNLKRGEIPNTSKGITLIALVITIIVLLILAGVAINMAINSDGLFSKANEAVEKYEQARKNESYAISDLLDTLTEIQTGIKVEQVTDEKPGELEGTGTETEPYTINSIEDLVFFSHDVRNGNTYAEKYVKLGLSLDFNSNKSYVNPLRTDYSKYGYYGELKTLLTTGEGFKPIGDYKNSETNNFSGVFSGNNKVICNLYINLNNDAGFLKVGLFGINKGTIKNLGLENVNITAKCLINGTQMGSISGQLAKTGTIEKCYAKGSLNVATISVGGITAYTTGTIKDCYSAINITNAVSDVEASDIVTMGGIVSQTGSEANISNSYNIGKLEQVSTGLDVYAGGVAGGLNRTSISNCYNAGDILVNSTKGTRLYVGGISGSLDSMEVKNCCSKGKMEINSNEIEKLGIGGVAGLNYNSTTEDCSYLPRIAETGIGMFSGSITEDTTIAVEKETDMASILTVVGEAFKNDTNNINNGYPILDWQ